MTTTLDIISDPICPWCYIGKARLDRALESRPDHAFDIHWRPFQLNPEMPPEGMDRRAYLEAKFGGREGALKVYGQIAEMAEATGLDINFEAIKRTPNTIDAHRLIRWSRNEGRQTMVVSQLFHRYFKLGEDISDHNVLLDVAKTVGIDPALIERLLSGDADIAETQAEDKQAREMGVTGVPTFVVGAKYAVVGAQEPDTWIKMIDDLATAVDTQTAT